MSISHLLSLPLELRRHIYKTLFSSTTLTYPHFTSPLPLPNSQIRAEALPLFRQHVRFDFTLVEHLVDYLTSIPKSTLTELRHIRVNGLPFPVYSPENRASYMTYLLPRVLKLFPGLRLDSLEVIDPYHGPGVDEDGWGHGATYYDVETLIKEGKGFKRLIFVSPNDRLFETVTFRNHDTNGNTTEEVEEREPQPSVWDRMMKERDGKDSGAGVTMFKYEERKWVKVGAEYEVLRGHDASAKEVPIRVEVQRGRNADFVEDGKSLYHDELQNLFRDMTWKEIKYQGLFLAHAEDDPTAHL